MAVGEIAHLIRATVGLERATRSYRTT
jgi:hypothetical protein